MYGPTWARGLNGAIRLFLTSLMILGHWSEVDAGQNVTSSGQGGNQPKLSIVIVEGEGAINNVRQRVAREVIVQVNDENNRPIGGVAVSFLLPASGPGGLFANGTNALSVATDAAGRAVAGFTPNTVSGAFQLNATASFQGQVATTVVSQTNALAAAGAVAGGVSTGTVAGGVGGGISAATVAVVAAAVAAAVAVGVVVSKKGGDSPPPPPTIRIGVGGTPTVGAPGGWQQTKGKTILTPTWRR